ncbi:unnamed protein product [Paramecium octaurelia]|uniref:Uncharacterized protein n=1 Tax=Paramecium octaurelia TaxID=43137 RepID=A0A8S1URJ3_PAROT|nr:unnamed protein product [Paramecium octaurelia]
MKFLDYSKFSLITLNTFKLSTHLRMLNRRSIKQNDNIKIELTPQQNKNNYKTPSLNKIQLKHNKEIIMIDIDTKEKKVDNRFACLDCICDHPHCQYRTIEKVNQEWNYTKQQQDQVLNNLKLKGKKNKKN